MWPRQRRGGRWSFGRCLIGMLSRSCFHRYVKWRFHQRLRSQVIGLGDACGVAGALAGLPRYSMIWAGLRRIRRDQYFIMPATAETLPRGKTPHRAAASATGQPRFIRE